MSSFVNDNDFVVPLNFSRIASRGNASGSSLRTSRTGRKTLSGCPPNTRFNKDTILSFVPFPR
jgi:hypothetical protein